MKKFLLSLLTLVLLLPWAANAQNSWTIADGTYLHSKVPLDFYNCDGSGERRAQMLYPASLLSEMTGNALSAISFYHQSGVTKTLTSSTWYLKLGITDETDLSSGFSDIPLTTVYSGNLIVTSGVITFEFNSAYTYTGGNLIVEIYTTGASGNWFGSSSQGCYGVDNVGSTYSSMSSPNATDFVPKVTFTKAPSCFPVTIGKTTNITTTSARINWTDNTNSGATYTITDGNGINITTAAGATYYDLTALTANTTYSNLTVTANCGSDGSSTAANVPVFKTQCNPTGLPYGEINFDELNDYSMPDCWTLVEGKADGTSSGSGVYSLGSPYNGSSKHFRFYGSLNTVITMPPLSVEANTTQVKFYAKAAGNSATYGTLQVGYLTNASDASTFVAVKTLDYSDYQSYTLVKVPMISAPNGAVIAFRHQPTYTSYGWYIDNVTIDEVPTCLPVNVNSVTFNGQYT